jgi:CheY-like chemotaxis protein
MLELNKKNKLGDVVNMLEPRLFEGFGLNITQRVADMIGGTVTYTLDEPSCYVSISFHIPDNYLVSQSSSIKEATSETKMSSRSYSFLIVEDSLPIQKVMTGSLEKLGHVCVCANNGQDALNKLHSRNEDDMFDLIVMDLRMPIIRNTPIVVVSADCTSLVKESVLKAGANAFYDKPVPISAILRFLEKI